MNEIYFLIFRRVNKYFSNECKGNNEGFGYC
ncbi:hypothetical protein EPIR_3343 [Erwinia piriflorinigrans CFBP 5888]|uniref:Uncharacterized protein n=1 Tax=Erwinia piriflorinigrans CFBP 5888 TaxID=1161919 RepID=V5ZCP6_9GAMM|nr:hypothetical protein EPIR_3343 [Erwinia piriflorinigrans CFBP 5888]